MKLYHDLNYSYGSTLPEVKFKCSKPNKAQMNGWLNDRPEVQVQTDFFVQKFNFFFKNLLFLLKNLIFCSKFDFLFKILFFVQNLIFCS